MKRAAAAIHLIPIRRRGAWVVAVLLVLLQGSGAGGIRSDRWRWSNPLPHGNNVLDMLANSELSVQVGDAGAVHIQRLDERWAPVDTGVDRYLRGVALMGDRILVSGEGGTLLWSDDGEQFLPAQLSPANDIDWFEGVAASAQRAVAVGDDGTIYTSTNGLAWTQVASGTTEWLRGVAFGGGVFVAVGENGKILRAPTSAASWTATASGTAQHLNRVRYLGLGGAGKFYAVGNQGVVLRSDTGTTWTPLASGTTNNLYDIALNNTGLLAVGDQEVRTSTDGGATWNDQVAGFSSNAAPAWVYLSAHGRTDAWLVAGRAGLMIEGAAGSGGNCLWQPYPSYSPHAWLWDLEVQNGTCVAVGDLASIITSLDGILWAREAVPVAHTNTVLLGVGGTSNLLLAVGNDGGVLASRAGPVVVPSTNVVDGISVATNIVVEGYGVVWSNVPPFTAATLQGIAAADGLFVVAGDQGTIFTSPDGTSWTARTTPTTNFLSGVAIGPAACVAVGANGTLLRAGPDGSAWSAVALATTEWLFHVRWLGGVFVAVGQNGTILTSTDGMAWTSRSSGTARWLTDAAWLDGAWHVCGYQGTLLSSTNLVDWVSQRLPTGKSLFGAAAKDGRLLLAGVEGVVLRNQAVPPETPVEVLDYTLLHATDTNSVSSLYELFLFGGEPDQVFDFQSTTNLAGHAWTVQATLELYDPSGTLYAIRSRPSTNTPPAECYRALAVP